MKTRKRIRQALVCARLALIAVTLVFWLYQQPEAASIPLLSESGVHVGELAEGAPVDETSVSAVVNPAPTVVRSSSAAMVPPPVREAVDPTAKVETLPRAEGYVAMLFTKTSAATLRALADDPAANTVLRLSARHSLSLLAE